MHTDGDRPRLLILDDAPSDADLVEAELRAAGLEFVSRRAENEPEFVAALDEFRPDLVLSDYSLPSFNGPEALRLVQQRVPPVPVIILTGSINEETAVECMKAGAADYVLKDRLARLPAAVRGALEGRRLAEDSRRAKEALRESEDQLRAMFELASVGIAQADPRTGRWLRVNQKMCSITGFSAEELLGLQLRDITHPDDRQEDWEAFQRVVTGEAVDYRLEKRYLRKDGSVVWVNVNMTVIRGEDGRPIRTVAMIEDITERRRADEDLRKSKQIILGILDAIPVRVFWKDKNLVYLGCNAIFAGDAGFADPQDLIGKDDYQMGWRDQAELYRSDDRQVIESGVPKILKEEPQTTPRGDTITLLTSKVPLRDSSGAVSGVLGTYMDITEHKRAEEALRESEARFKAAFASSPIGMALVALDGRFLELNSAFCQIVGYSEEEMLGKVFQEITHPDDLDSDLANVRRMLAGEIPAYQMEKRYLHKQGHIVWVLLSVALVRDRAGQPLYFVSQVQDVTERKVAAQALRESEERFRLIAENTADVIWTLDLATHRFTYVSPSIERLRGFTPEEVLAQPFEASLTPDSLARVEAHLSAALAALAAGDRSGRTLTMEVDQPTKKGGTVRTEIVASALTDANGRVTGALGVTRDVTDRTMLEEQLRQSQKMEAMGQLAGGVAHDFNNLLQAMLSLTQMLVGHLTDPERLKADAVELEQLVKRGAGLTRQLLLFSRREALNPERLDLNEVVRDGLALLRRLLKAHVAIEASLAEGRLPVEGDRGQIGQVLMNLAVNAGDAMPGGGRLAIATGSAPGVVWMRIADTGGGIPAAIRDHVFEPFFTTKERGKGTGLGLSVVHGIVTRHGGTVTLDVREGEGTTFTVTLPRAASGDSRAVEVAERGSGLARGQGELVLVVEDEASARQALAEILTMLGYRVTAVGSGEEAGRLAPKKPFDLLLTDLMLPGVSGADLAIVLQARWPDLRVVLMSGYAEDEAVRLGTQAGVVRFLQKPFDLEMLARELRAALDTA